MLDYNRSDWTGEYDQREIASQTGRLVDELLTELYAARIVTSGDLAGEEFRLLYRFPVHVACNFFVERLLRTVVSEKNNESGETVNISADRYYYLNSFISLERYYYDQDINRQLLGRLAKALRGEAIARTGSSAKAKLFNRWSVGELFNPKKIIRRFLDRSELARIRRSKPRKLADKTEKMKYLLEDREMMIFNYQLPSVTINLTLRFNMRDVFEKVFIAWINNILPNLNNSTRDSLAILFADFVDRALPVAVVEGLPETLAYYSRLLIGWDIKQVHSATGYYRNDNFKIFALLAKRKKALLIGHQHGASNMISSRKQAANELAFLDYYFAWGKNDSDWLKGEVLLPRLKTISFGSTYLTAIPKWNKPVINGQELTLFYPSGPLMDFMTDLEEISPEKNRVHRLQVLQYLKELKRLYPGLRVLYKPFPGTYANDPIKEVFADELKAGSVGIVSQKPHELFAMVDLVLWDTVSTGFAESVQAGVPTLVFHNEWECLQATVRGKEIDRELAAAGIIFYEASAGLRSFKMIVDDNREFLNKGRLPIRKFQAEVAWPVSRQEFFEQAKAIL
ncbi:MAG: hypothetical protein WC601_00370 [Desulfotomaculaceae bacterium]